MCHTTAGLSADRLCSGVVDHGQRWSNPDADDMSRLMDTGRQGAQVRKGRWPRQRTGRPIMAPSVEFASSTSVVMSAHPTVRVGGSDSGRDCGTGRSLVQARLNDLGSLLLGTAGRSRGSLPRSRPSASPKPAPCAPHCPPSSASCVPPRLSSAMDDHILRRRSRARINWG